MSTGFSLRFVLADEQPTLASIQTIWAGGPQVRRLDDGVLELMDGERVLARVDLLSADDARGQALLSAIRREAERHGSDQAVQTVSFVLDSASGVVIAQPVVTQEEDLEAALDPLDALWEYLFAHHGGLLQVDGEGIYVEEGPLVELP